MLKNSLRPTKELVDPASFYEAVQNMRYPKPQWMLNESVFDNTWFLSKVGIDSTYSKGDSCGFDKMCFNRLVSPGEYLTDNNWAPLLTDIRNSLLYLDVAGKINRPKRIRDILISATYLFLHVNEIRQQSHKPLAKNLQQIKFDELKGYLLSFEVKRNVFDSMLNDILQRWESKKEIDWEVLKLESGMNTRSFRSLRHKLTQYLDSNLDDFKSQNSYLRDSSNANCNIFDADIDLTPKEKTISNEISKLEALYTSRPAQIFKFRHSPMKLFSSGATIFENMTEPTKTKLMPVNVSFHALSSALSFARIYGPALREYLSELKRAEKERIKLSGYGPTSITSIITSIQDYSFKTTPIPNSLKDLNITSWGGRSNETRPNSHSEGMSLCSTITLYTAAIWILLASFTAARTSSFLTLRRDCFKHSPVDGLYDLVLRIPKSSERHELEDIHRPIPDLIYDYGLEFSSLVDELEQRRGIITNNSKSFLFGRILTERSMSAYSIEIGEFHRHPISADYVSRAIHIFQDWSGSPLINGKRWYLSTHQFRRLFAVLYFNFSDEVGLDELSWFMGHSNIDQTFHYAELSPSDEWIEEAELTIARIGASLGQHIFGDNAIQKIVENARSKSCISTVLEPLVHSLIQEYKAETGKQVRFKKIDGKDVFFYFHENEG